jgi:hypothetical protein
VEKRSGRMVVVNKHHSYLRSKGVNVVVEHKKSHLFIKDLADMKLFGDMTRVHFPRPAHNRGGRSPVFFSSLGAERRVLELEPWGVLNRGLHAQ